jgi:hypothetical protein
MTTQAAEPMTSYATALVSGALSKSKNEANPTQRAATNGASESCTKSSLGVGNSTGEISRQSSPSIVGLSCVKDDDLTTATVSDDKSNGWDGVSQTSSHPSSGAETVKGSEVVSAPQPNFWTKRQEEIAAKKATLPAMSVELTNNASHSPKTASSEKGYGVVKKSGILDERERSKEGDVARDNRKNSDDSK